MIVPRGVVIGEDMAEVITRALAAGVRSGAIDPTPDVLRVIGECESVSARTSVDVRPLDSIDEPTERVAEAAARYGVSPRTIRRWADSGRLRAVREDGRWLIGC